jgi:hypothetical protein
VTVFVYDEDPFDGSAHPEGLLLCSQPNQKKKKKPRGAKDKKKQAFHFSSFFETLGVVWVLSRRRTS